MTALNGSGLLLDRKPSTKFTKKTMQATVKKAEFVSSNEVKLTLTINIPTGTNASARFLVGMAEAGLLDVEVDKVATRRTRTKLKKGEKTIAEERHGHGLFIVMRRNQRRLYCAFDFLTPFQGKKQKTR